MNAQFTKMFSEVEGRYLDANETTRLKDFADSLEQRLAVSLTVEGLEDQIVATAMEKVFEKYPEMRKGPGVEDKCDRDMRLVLRYCTLAMVRDDEQFLADKCLYWLRTILQSFFPRKLIDETYRSLARGVEAHLDRDQLEYMAPYLRLTHKILTQDS